MTQNRRFHYQKVWCTKIYSVTRIIHILICVNAGLNLLINTHELFTAICEQSPPLFGVLRASQAYPELPELR